MLGLAFWRLEEQWAGQGEFAGEPCGVPGGEKRLYPVCETVRA